MARKTPLRCTPQQYKYARNLISGNPKFMVQGKMSKKAMMEDAGYNTPNASNIEKSKGFHHAMAHLSRESGDAVLIAIHELKRRHFGKMDPDQLLKAVDVISGAWERFSAPLNKVVDDERKKENALRDVFIQDAEIIDEEEGGEDRETAKEEVKQALDL